MTRRTATATAIAACKTYFGALPTGKSCDEYPFATTYEGAAKGDNRYSVRYVVAAQNSLAGSRLGSFYGADRVLDNDFFWVSITS
jgi:Deoxyribonuclease NucA/NucB